MLNGWLHRQVALGVRLASLLWSLKLIKFGSVGRTLQTGMQRALSLPSRRPKFQNRFLEGLRGDIHNQVEKTNAQWMASMVQTITNGYFGGYIGKRQPCRKAELKKCINQMYNLRNKTNDKGASAQHRAVSGRMITDLEMNGTYRRAVQITNLCRHLRHDDVLFAECTSTFASCQLYGRTMN